jgi:hypothetical protein
MQMPQLDAELLAKRERRFTARRQSVAASKQLRD